MMQECPSKCLTAAAIDTLVLLVTNQISHIKNVTLRSDPYSALQVLTRVSERSCDLIEHTHSNRSCDLTPSNDCIIMIISELLTTADYIQHNYNDIHARQQGLLLSRRFLNRLSELVISDIINNVSGDSWYLKRSCDRIVLWTLYREGFERMLLATMKTCISKGASLLALQHMVIPELTNVPLLVSYAIDYYRLIHEVSRINNNDKLNELSFKMSRHLSKML